MSENAANMDTLIAETWTTPPQSMIAGAAVMASARRYSGSS
jgi:hypothetical protein